MIIFTDQVIRIFNVPLLRLVKTTKFLYYAQATIPCYLLSPQFAVMQFISKKKKLACCYENICWQFWLRIFFVALACKLKLQWQITTKGDRILSLYATSLKYSLMNIWLENKAWTYATGCSNIQHSDFIRIL